MKAEYRYESHIRYFSLPDEIPAPARATVTESMCCGLRHVVRVRLELDHWDTKRGVAVYNVASTEIQRTDQ